MTGAENASGLAVAVLPALGLACRFADLCGFKPRSTQRPYARGLHDKAPRVRRARPRTEGESGRAHERVVGAQTCLPHTAMHKSSVKWLQLQRRISYESDVYLAAAPPP
jgi:hypothetical protein